ncbi:MAG: large repetitive protein, partial [Thermoanaerobaculia bacterium]|nr:large repetitive protein [Thermoanaerobaculia bacterium]
MRRTRFAFLLFSLFAAMSLFGRQLPNIDKLGEHAPSPAKAAELAQKTQSFSKQGLPMSSEPRFGVPTFLWGGQAVTLLNGAPFKANPSSTPGSAEGAARGYVGNVASLYNLGTNDVATAPLSYIHDLGSGPVIVKLHQTIDGIDIFREEINVVMNQKLDLVAISGYIASQSTPPNKGSLGFTLGSASAAVNAVSDLTEVNLSALSLISAGSHDGYDYYTVSPASGVSLIEPVRMKKVFFHMPEGLEPAYYIEVLAQNTSIDPSQARIDDHTNLTDGYSYVISAVDGSILFRNNLTADAAGNKIGNESNLAPGGFTYRVWADPSTGIPYDTPAGNGVHPKINVAVDGVQYPFVSMQNVQLPNYPFSQNDPWLAAGATQTNGNNVDAFADLQTPDDFTPVNEPPVDPPTGDHHAFTSAVDSFIYTHQPDVDAYSAAARQASITQLFYNINFLHDWYYDSGFNEVSRNAQTNNFGRGGIGSDNIKGQSQDFQSFSNANMLTPADGGRPRMRMYNFPNLANMLDVQAPAAIVGKTNIGIAQSGIRNFDITTNIVIPVFTASPACTITNAAALAGNIGMFDFGTSGVGLDGTGCSFSTRITRIHATSAVAALMVYTSASPTAVANITGLVASHTKPIGVISFNAGAPIKTQIAGAATVTARLLRVADRDGSLDQQIVFHEWGHYLSNRLIGNGNGLNANYAGGMGEGWGDINAMMLTVREADTGTASNSNWNGAYALATYATSGVPFNGAANQGYYYGIRRYPYSTDMTINPLTFHHIQNGIPLPVSPAPAFGQTGSNNAEVHNTGEVWANMYWECYAAILRDTLGPTPRMDFTTAQTRMKQYLVASLKITPITPTMLETRDALLAAAFATDLIDFQEFNVAFAKRGAGLGAISPDRFSGTNATVTESFIRGGDLSFVSATLDDSNGSCDIDGIFDNNEGGKLTITLKNTGDIHLSATTGTVSTTNPNVVIAGGGALTFGPSDPYGLTTATVGVTMTGAAGIQTVDLNVSFNDPALAVAGPRNATPYVAANESVVPASTATDAVEAPATQWTTSGTNLVTIPGIPWARQQQPASINHIWFGTDGYYGMDQYLTSPVMTVNGSGSVNIQFDHSFGFEFDGGGNYDGGVVEYSVNGGPFTDMGTAGGLPNYNGNLLVYSGNVNPLAGRPGFVQNSGGTIHTSFTKAIAPGSTVQVRFRSASDSSVGSTGWTVDNIAFTGVVETPFSTVVADPGCTALTSTVLTASANPSPAGVSVTFTATVSSTRGAPTAGTVTFYDGASPLATNPVASGVATYSTSSLTIGSHPLTATYNPVPGFAGSTSSILNETINQATSTTVVTSSVNPVNLLTPVTYFVTVTASNGVTPTGNVAIYDNAVFKTNSALNGSGVGTWSTVYTAGNGGTHVITATYGGNATTAGSTSAGFNEYVDPSSFNFSPTTYYKLENGGNVTLTITRTGGTTTGAASVNVSTADGSAVNGVRYTTTNVTVNFAGGETSKTV